MLPFAPISRRHRRAHLARSFLFVGCMITAFAVGAAVKDVVDAAKVIAPDASPIGFDVRFNPARTLCAIDVHMMANLSADAKTVKASAKVWDEKAACDVADATAWLASHTVRDNTARPEEYMASGEKRTTLSVDKSGALVAVDAKP